MSNTDFNALKIAVEQQWESLQDLGDLYKVDISKDALKSYYLQAFPPGSNPVYRENTVHDCNCCKSWVGTLGGVVAIDSEYKVHSIWDVSDILPEDQKAYKEVCQTMSELVRSAPIREPLLISTKYREVGMDFNYDTKDNTRWDHFYTFVPDRYVHDNPQQVIGEFITSVGVFKRGLEEISMEAVETCLNLIRSKSLYRGQEFMGKLERFQELLREYHTLSSLDLKNNFVWRWPNGSTTIKNSALGTLLVDLSKPTYDLEDCIQSFERKMEGYKVSSAGVTETSVKRAEQKARELGVVESLERRHATPDDVPLDQVIYQARNSLETPVEEPSPFNKVTTKPTKKNKGLRDVKTVTLEQFLTGVLPEAESVEIQIEKKLVPHLMTLTAKARDSDKDLLKWPGGVSWSYNGGKADSTIKERVKKEGGNVSGWGRVSLSWDGPTDLDIHLREHWGDHVYFSHRTSKVTGATLDVDANASSLSMMEHPVENIVFPDKSKIRPGTYEISVNNYKSRKGGEPGFTLETEFDGKVCHYRHPNKLLGGDIVLCLVIDVDSVHNVTITPTNKVTKQEYEGQGETDWGLDIGNFSPVRMITKSPNYWNPGSSAGNEHFFFILEGCKSPDPTKGFYIEQLRPDLFEHRKVFQQLSDSTMVQPTDAASQLSGLGFSTAKPQTFIARVKGPVNRVVEVQI